MITMKVKIKRLGLVHAITHVITKKPVIWLFWPWVQIFGVKGMVQMVSRFLKSLIKVEPI